MKVYIVFDYLGEGGIEIFHIASTKTKAKTWICNYKKEHPNSVYFLDIDEVEIDGEYEQ